MSIERALTIPGWMTEAELSYIADRASRSKIIVELGSWRGRSAVAWSENTDGIVYCVDTWDINAFGDVRFPGDTDELYTRTEWLLTEFMRLWFAESQRWVDALLKTVINESAGNKALVESWVDRSCISACHGS